MTEEAQSNKNPSAHADLSVGCGAGAARTWALRSCSPGARGALSVLTVKNLCWGQNYDLVLFKSKKNHAIREFMRLATCGFVILSIPIGADKTPKAFRLFWR